MVVQQWINGKLTSDSNAGKLSIYNPALGKQIREVVLATPEEITLTISIAKQAFHSWAAFTPLKRSRVLFKFKQILEERIDLLANVISEEHGKLFEDAKGEVLRAIELVEFCCGIPQLLRGSYSENVGPQIDCYTVRQPLGICVGVSPFNFPVMVPSWLLIPAIACGNTFILKPSEKDPSAPLLLAQWLKEAGLPDGVFNILNGDKNTVQTLITHPDVMAVSCVGSTPVAESIYQTAIAHGKRAQTFGGAKNHCVVMPDADLNDAATAILGAAYGAAGERCMALSVVVAVTDPLADALIERLKAEIPAVKVGIASDTNAQLGPLVTQEHHAKVKSYVDLGVKEGAKLLIDGRDFKLKNYEAGFFMAPCLFDGVTKEMRIYQEEIFGPVLCIVRAPDLKTALQLINSHPFGNGTAIFTRDGETARIFAHEVQAGMVGINVPIPVPVAYHSFGGWKRSVFGDVTMHGDESIRFYTHAKSVTTRWPKGQGNVYHMPNS